MEKNGFHGTANAAFDGDEGVHVSVVETNRKLPAKEDTAEAVDTRLGLGSCKPQYLQSLNKMSLFVLWAFILCFLEGFAVNGIANAGLPAIEKHFSISSTKSSVVASSQDFGALAVVLFVSFVGARLHKPRFVACGSVIMAIGSFLFIVPHLVEEYKFGGALPASGPTGACNGTRGAAMDPAENCDSPGDRFIPALVIAQMIHGIGFSPMFTLGLVYIEENEEPSLAAVYIGLTYAAAAIGVAAGFFIGGQILQNYFVDFDRVSVDFDAQDPRWVGAWWFGFIFTAILFIIIAIPISLYPKSMPGSEKYRVDNKPKHPDNDKLTLCQLAAKLFKLFIKTFLNLLKNPVFMLLNLAGSSQTLIIAGVGAFSFKFLTEQYNLNFDDSGYLIGGLILVGSFGMFLGGLLVKIFRLEILGMTRLCAGAALLAGILGIAFLAGCPEVPIAGLEVAYPGRTTIDGFADACHATCDCERQSFSTVCGADQTVYYSPCHAGCTELMGMGPTSTYYNCSCIAGAATARPGRCEDNCTQLKILAPCMFIAMVAVLTAVTPTSMATMRCVDEQDKPFALGIQWVFVRLLGMIPGPVLVGWVLDRSCLLWSGGSCGSSGSCLLYSHDKMAVGVMLWWVMVSLVASVLFFIASIIVVCKNSSKSFDLKSEAS
ncbi:solute carrier organic anion transporter family member 4A1-like [Ostrea edulis]|uniref:solute carrier organic anion transporter family member 4A1-like n=1 Tax=Ostrea edulis TaxID=37623 RepID=UPI0024AFCD5F|nr:solute carrier organic anion transporter family member 4A1-like [Ostrea edulis]XP_048736626.2 solute carrier organic anion transporter family member 4A1-like [Ostrea edulis]